MSTVTVRGYDEKGETYIVRLDDSEVDDLTGVFAVGRPALVAAAGAHTGEQGSLHPTAPSVAVGIETIEGALAYLVKYTEVVSMTGDLPSALVRSEDEPVDAVY